MKSFTEDKDGRKFCIYERISNGYILTTYDEKSGSPIVNTKFFVSFAEYKINYKEFKFDLPTNEKESRAVASALLEINDQLRNHGIIEESSNLLLDLSRSEKYCGLFRTMVDDSKLDIDSILEDFDDDYYYEECRDAFNFIYSLVPVLKKIIVQSKENKEEEQTC